MSKNGKTRTLRWQSGSDGRAIAEFLAAVVKSTPLLSWVEPWPRFAPGTALGPLPGFQGLARGRPSLAGVMAEEVRLYWPDALLQVVAQGQGCRWFACGEESLPVALEPKAAEEEQVYVHCYDVHLRQDWKRFLARPADAAQEPAGEQAFSDINKVKVVEYRQGAAVFAWRLLPHDQRNV